MHDCTITAIGLVFVGFVLLTFTNSVSSSNFMGKVQRLPGPMQLPYLGRIHDLPIHYMWRKFKAWADIYGPIYYTSMLGTKFVIVSDETIVEELLVKRAKIYSDRPAVQSIFDSKSTYGSMEYLPLMGKNMYWSRQRKLSHSFLKEASNARYHGVIDFEVQRWLFRLLEDPEGFYFSLEDMASKITCTLSWDNPDVSIDLTKSARSLLRQISPAGPITNVITPLWHLPLWLNPWKMAERRRHDEQQAWWMARLFETREKMHKNELRPCWTSQYLENAHLSSLSGDYEASSCLGMLALVGIITVSGPLRSFLMAMVLHQEWMLRVQQEVDTICGERMPTTTDYANLPVLRACIKETMRWRPGVPTGVAHELEVDDVYRGYLIRKGTRVLPLDCALLRNPTKYPDPESFRPERWLSPEWPTFQEPLSAYPTIKGMTSFGWGRRVCLGQNLAQDELLVACGAVCWAFDLRHKVDSVSGQSIEIDANRTNSLLIVDPDPFQMSIRPRSERKRDGIAKMWKDARDQDRQDRAATLRAATV